MKECEGEPKRETHAHTRKKEKGCVDATFASGFFNPGGKRGFEPATFRTGCVAGEPSNQREGLVTFPHCAPLLLRTYTQMMILEFSLGHGSNAPLRRDSGQDACDWISQDLVQGTYKVPVDPFALCKLPVRYVSLDGQPNNN